MCRVAEILVVGRRTQNSDIRRSENDVQPYTVATREEILGAHRDNIDQYFTSRVTANTTVVPPTCSKPENRIRRSTSAGWAPTARWCSSMGGDAQHPIPGGEFRQADLNGIPLHAIERIEVLTGAAGGIHGFGALGGVVNVVLDRDSRGLDLHLTGGTTRAATRPNKPWKRGSATPPETARLTSCCSPPTTSRTPCSSGEREYAVRDRRRMFEIVPQYYQGQYPFGNSVTVRSFFRLDPVTGELELNPDLVLKPEYGGAALGSESYISARRLFGDASALAAALTQHAGEMDFSLPEMKRTTIWERIRVPKRCSRTSATGSASALKPIRRRGAAQSR